jgi:hypothetical protein
MDNPSLFAIVLALRGMPSPFAGTASCYNGHSRLYVSLFLTPVVSETNDTAIKASCQGFGDIDKPPEYDYIKG